MNRNVKDNEKVEINGRRYEYYGFTEDIVNETKNLTENSGYDINNFVFLPSSNNTWYIYIKHSGFGFKLDEKMKKRTQK
jgi:hypothetical protein